MNNIDAFNIAVAEIFGQCYKEFPLRVDISKLGIGVAIKTAFGDDPDGVFNLAEKEYLIAEEAMNWLIEAGYLWCRNPRKPISFEGVTLTPKGLEVLNATPNSLVSQTSLGEYLSKGIGYLGKEAASIAVKEGLSFGFKLLSHT